MGGHKPIDVRNYVVRVHPDEVDLPEHERTEWCIYPLPGLARREIKDLGFGLDHGPIGQPVPIVRGGTREYLALKYGLGEPMSGPFVSAWEEVPNAALGRAVPSDDFLNVIGPELWDWLVSQVQDVSTLSEEDAGKSKRQSGSPSGTSGNEDQTAESAVDPEAA